MKPFNSIAEVTSWFMSLPKRRRVSVLIDWTDIGQGIQKREVHKDSGLWVVGFTGGPR